MAFTRTFIVEYLSEKIAQIIMKHPHTMTIEIKEARKAESVTDRRGIPYMPQENLFANDETTITIKMRGNLVHLLALNLHPLGK